MTHKDSQGLSGTHRDSQGLTGTHGTSHGLTLTHTDSHTAAGPTGPGLTGFKHIGGTNGTGTHRVQTHELIN